MKTLVMCFACLLVGVLIGTQLSDDSPPSEEKESQYNQLHETVAQQAQVITKLQNARSELENSTSSALAADADYPVVAEVQAKASGDLNPDNQDPPQTPFQTALLTFQNEATDSEWAVNAERQIEALFSGEANDKGIYFSQLECRATQCYMALDGVDFFGDFENILREMFENEQLVFGDAVFSPDPLEHQSEVTDYQIIFVSPIHMNENP